MAYCYHSGSKYKGVWVMQGTAFYLNYKQRVYLFSALHNFTGVDPETNKLLNSVAGKTRENRNRGNFLKIVLIGVNIISGP